MRKTLVLLLMLVLVVTALPAHAQPPLRGEYVSEDGSLRFRYPDNWEVDVNPAGGVVRLGSSDIVMDQYRPDSSGDVFILFDLYPAFLLDLYPEGINFDTIDALLARRAMQADQDYEAPQDFELPGGRSGVYVAEVPDSASDDQYVWFAFQLEGGHRAVGYVLTYGADETPTAMAIARAIFSSIEYRPDEPYFTRREPPQVQLSEDNLPVDELTATLETDALTIRYPADWDADDYGGLGALLATVEFDTVVDEDTGLELDVSFTLFDAGRLFERLPERFRPRDLAGILRLVGPQFDLGDVQRDEMPAIGSPVFTTFAEHPTAFFTLNDYYDRSMLMLVDYGDGVVLAAIIDLESQDRHFLREVLPTVLAMVATAEVTP